MQTIVLVLYLSLLGETPTTTTIYGFTSVKTCEHAAEAWLADKAARRDVYVASAQCKEHKK